MEGNGPAQDFETMLRVRLQRHKGRLASRASAADGSDQIPCRGFDPERASAFLEGALSASDCARYEEHITACLACRQGVVALGRLPVASEPLPQLVPQVWSTEKGWFHRFVDSLRAAPIQWAGVATATCGLVLALSLFALRPVTSPVPQASNSVAAPNALALAIPEQEQAANIAGQMPQASESSKARLNLVSPPGNAPINGRTTDQLGLQSKPILPKTESLDLILGTVGNRQLAQLSPSGLAGAPPQQMTSPVVSQGAQIASPSSQLVLPAPQAFSDQQELMRVDALGVQSRAAGSQRAAGTQSSSDKRKTSIAEMEFLPRGNFMKGLPTPSPTPNIEDEDIRAMTRKVQGKTFRFERGKWIDQQFRTQFFLLRVRIDRGSEQYKKVLSDIPALQVFFDLGPVTVVWQGKIYEVK